MKSIKNMSAVLLACLFGASAHAAPAYTVQQKWTLGEAGKWDYTDIDAVRHRLFITRGTRVQVLDLPSGQVAGEIASTAGVHGVAFAQDLKLGFTSNGRANSVTVFDPDTLKVKQELAIPGMNPDAILYEPQSHKVYTFNGNSGDVTVIDALTLKVVATVKVGGKLEFAVSDGAKVYFNIEDKSEIGVIDVASNKLDARWKLAGCEEPSGLAFDQQHARLFSVCQNKIMAVTDSKTGKRVTDVAIGEHPDAAVYDAASATVFSSNGGGTLSVIRQLDADHYEASQVATVKGARTMAMDHASQTVYLPTAVDKVFTVLVVAP